MIVGERLARTTIRINVISRYRVASDRPAFPAGSRRGADGHPPIPIEKETVLHYGSGLTVQSANV